MNGHQNEKLTLTREEAANLIGIGLRSIDAMVKENSLPSFKVKGRRLFLKEKLVEWLRSRGES